MMKEQVYLQPGFVLHQRAYQNTSAIIDVFSRDYGRLSLIAKGVKRKKSPLKSVLQSFQPLSLSWVRRSDLGVLTYAELQPSIIQLDHEILYSGLYLNELIVRLVPAYDAMPDLFDAYSKTLTSLCHADNESVAIPLRLFEKKLLQALGYEILFDLEADGHTTIIENEYYVFIPEQGFMPVCGAKQTARHFKGEYLLAFAAGQLEKKETQHAAHRLMHMSLKRLLGDKPLKSRELYKAYRSIHL